VLRCWIRNYTDADPPISRSMNDGSVPTTPVQAGPVVAPIALLVKAAVMPCLFFKMTGFVTPDSVCLSIPVSVSRVISAFSFAIWRLKTGPIIAPVALLVRSSISPRPIFQASRIFGIKDVVQRSDCILQVLR
jgi:hypothetical protein